MTLRARILCAFLLLNSLGVFYFLHWIRGDLSPRYREAVEESLAETAEILANLLAEDSREGVLTLEKFIRGYTSALRRPLAATIYDLPKEHVELRTYLTDEHGTVRFDSRTPENVGKDFSRWNDVFRTLKGVYGARTTRDHIEDPTSTVLYVAAPVIVGGKIIGTVTVGKPMRNINAFIDRARAKFLLVALLVVGAQVLLILLISLWVTSPLKKLRHYADGVRAGRRISPPETSIPELRELGNALDGMKRELEGKQYVENYVQTLTHELKSPLAAIGAAAEILESDPPPQERSRFLKSIVAETGRIQHAIDSLLELSALERRTLLSSHEEVDLPTVILAVIEHLAPLFTANRVKVHTTFGLSLIVPGDAALLSRVFQNVLKNAIEFAPQGSQIDIGGQLVSGQVEIVIQDQGPGVPEFALPRVFDRFFSLQRPSGQKSSGLGLAITKEIVSLHHGTIELKNSRRGGAEVTLKFPHSPRSRTTVPESLRG